MSSSESATEIATATTATTTVPTMDNNNDNDDGVQEVSMENTIVGITNEYSTELLKQTLYDFYTQYSNSSTSNSASSNGIDSNNGSNSNNVDTAITRAACQHIYGFGCAVDTTVESLDSSATTTTAAAAATDWSQHTLSMLQTITATILLDYEKKDHRNATVLQQQEEKAYQFIQQNGPILNLQTTIINTIPTMALASEFKRASPSKGMIANTIDQQSATKQALLYMQGGTNIISCLTEPRYFHGTIQDLYTIRQVTQQQQVQQQLHTKQQQRPVLLRKDFIISKYMIAEAVANGADTILLIVAILPIPLLYELIQYCTTTFGPNLIPLVEVHTNEELYIAIQVGATCIGINNRNLHTFQLDLFTCERIVTACNTLQYIYHPKDIIQQHHNNNNNNNCNKMIVLCALSGMSTCYDIDRYRQIGISMCLIGESLMRSSNPINMIQSLCLNPIDYQNHQNHITSSTSTTTNHNNNNIDTNRHDTVNNTTTTMSSTTPYTGGTRIIKICGITNTQDALIACQAGANFIGMIFAENSKRRISSIEQAKSIVDTVWKFGERSNRIEYNDLPSLDSNLSPIQHIVQSTMSIVNSAKHRPLVVGVFQNQDITYINDMIQQCQLDIIQLHGNEGMAASNRCHYYNSIPVIRVIDITIDPITGTSSDSAVPTILQSITNDPSMLLLDTAIKCTATSSTNGTTNTTTGGGTGMIFDWDIAKQIQDCGIPVIVAGGLTPTSITDCIQQINTPFGIDVSSGVEISPGIKDHDKVRTFIQNAKSASTIEASK